jgi:multiple antibiotic resistance protein
VAALGPLKMIAPFGRVAARLTPAEQRRLAVESLLIGTVAVLLGGGLGSLLASNWGISTPIPTICAGLIFFRIATRTVLAQYELAMPETLADDTVPSAFRMALRMVVTPHGIAALVALLSLFLDDITRVIQVVAALPVVVSCGPDPSVWRRARCPVGGVGAAYPFDRDAVGACGQSARMTGLRSEVRAV